MTDSKTPIAGIILAAGMSSRLGSAKQLVRAGGQVLLDKILDEALARRAAAKVVLSPDGQPSAA